LYSECDIWIATSRLEGFHNPPAEAALCGCCVFVNNNKQNGCGDYATNETSHIYSSVDDLIEKIKCADYSKVIKMQTLIREKIGSRESNMAKLVEALK
jgi:hypothetical protein